MKMEDMEVRALPPPRQLTISSHPRLPAPRPLLKLQPVRAFSPPRQLTIESHPRLPAPFAHLFTPADALIARKL